VRSASPDDESLIKLRQYSQNVATHLREMFLARNVRFINASWGFTLESIRGPWPSVCRSPVPDEDTLLAILEAYRPVFDALFNTEGVFTAHAAIASDIDRHYPFDQKSVEFPNRLRVGFFVDVGDSVPEGGLVDDRNKYPTTYAIYPADWALAMNTPYPWTKQLAHLGGTRDGMIVRWGNGIKARGEIRHQWHHVIDVLPTILEAAGLEVPESFGGVAQQPVEGTSLAYSFDDADAPDRRSTQYFEMIGNRGVYHDGWTAVTRHGVPWEMVDTPERPFDEDVWELYDHADDWSQAHDLAEKEPERLRELQDVFQREAERYQVLPLDDRVTERENPDVAGRLDLHLGRSTLSFGPRVGRLSEEAAPNVKNRSHVVTADLEVVTGTNGVVVAQGGRFGGWSLYVVGGVPHYAYNFVGRDLTVVRGGKPMAPGRHDPYNAFDHRRLTDGTAKSICDACGWRSRRDPRYYRPGGSADEGGAGDRQRRRRADRYGEGWRAGVDVLRGQRDASRGAECSERVSAGQAPYCPTEGERLFCVGRRRSGPVSGGKRRAPCARHLTRG